MKGERWFAGGCPFDGKTLDYFLCYFWNSFYSSYFHFVARCSWSWLWSLVLLLLFIALFMCCIFSVAVVFLVFFRFPGRPSFFTRIPTAVSSYMPNYSLSPCVFFVAHYCFHFPSDTPLFSCSSSSCPPSPSLAFCRPRLLSLCPRSSFASSTLSHSPMPPSP